MRTQAIVRRMLPRLLLVTIALAASCRGACRRGEDRTATVEGRLALFPATTQMVVAVDAAKLRTSPAAAKLAALAQQAQADQQLLRELEQRTGLDLMQHLASVTLAFPEEARGAGEFGMLMRADHLDETRLVAYIRDELQKTGDDLVSTRRGRFTLWSAKRSPDLVGFVVDGHTLAVGGGGWGQRMADLAETARPGDSAATNVDLVRLVERVAASHAIWGAALVPPATRQKLVADPRFGSAAAVGTLSAGIDIGKGIDAVLVADLASAADARALVTKVTESLRDAKRSAQVLMLGLGPYLDGVTARAQDKTFELRATLGEPALDDLLGRARGLLELTRRGSPPGFGQMMGRIPDAAQPN